MELTFRHLLNVVRELIFLSAKNLGYISEEREEDEENFDISDSPRKEFGDITCNIAFKLSKSVKRRPYEIARDMVEKELNPHIKNYQKNRSQISMLPALDVLVSAEAHPAGYINFRVNYAVLGRIILKEIITNPNYGTFDIGNGQHVIVEHTSVNPNKALHVGHLRNVILGDTIYRMYDIHPFLSEKRKYVLKEIEDPKSSIAKFAVDITLKVLEDQLKTCWRVKARYDLLNFESHIVSSGLWSNTLALLKNQGLIFKEKTGKNKDCWIIRLKNGNVDPDDELEEADKVIVRSDGTSTYIAKDIPYAAWKTGLVDDPFSYRKFGEQWDGSVLWATGLNESNQNENTIHNFQSRHTTITIIDSRQSRLQKIISRILFNLKSGVFNDETIGEIESSNNYIHLGYEAVTINSQTAHVLGLDIGGREFIHMSGRKGIYVNADFVLDKLHEKALDEARKRNPRLADELLNEIAENIAISSIRYYLIKQDLNKIISFDIVECLSLEGETGPYLQYSYARSQRILEKSGQNYHSFGGTNFGLLNTSSEIDLIKILSKLDLVIEEAVVTLNPKALAKYAYELATTFNLYYEKVPILKEKHTETMLSRLILVSAFGIVLKKVLDLLGIKALCKM